MKCYYVCPKSVWEGTHESGVPHYALLPGSSHVELPGGFILLVAEVDKDGWEWSLNEWHQHPDVARLTHPAHERAIPLSHLHIHPEHAHKQFRVKHFQALQDAFGLEPTDTVWHLHAKIKDKYPGMKLSVGY
jgi:hypothetical protein